MFPDVPRCVRTHADKCSHDTTHPSCEHNNDRAQDKTDETTTTGLKHDVISYATRAEHLLTHDLAPTLAESRWRDQNKTNQATALNIQDLA